MGEPNTDFVFEEPYASIIFLVNMVYDRGVSLEYDLVNDRLEDARRRLADLNDMMPQVEGLTYLTTREEREDLVKALGQVSRYMEEGDNVLAQGAADEFNASFRSTMWNIIIRCREEQLEPLLEGVSLFPKTREDWTNLGIDIKEKDPSLSNEVNDALTKIYEGTPGAANESKRWLTQKAGELGIT